MKIGLFHESMSHQLSLIKFQPPMNKLERIDKVVSLCNEPQKIQYLSLGIKFNASLV